MPQKIVLAVDPSSTISGYCVGTPHKLIKCGVLVGPSSLDPDNRVLFQVKQLLHILSSENITSVTTLVVEKPATWGGGRGIKSAMSGALAVLARAEGVITTSLRLGLQPRLVYTIEAIRWKGQLPKEIMFDRMNKKYGLRLECKTQAVFNMTDAVGLFDWYLAEVRKGVMK